MKTFGKFLALLLVFSCVACGKKDKGGESKPVTPPTSDSSIHIDPSVTVTIRFFDGETLLKELSGHPGETVKGEPSPQNVAGYSFKGWAAGDETPQRHITVFPARSTDYYAKRTVKIFNITFQGFASYNGDFAYGQDLPVIPSTDFITFYGWREEIGIGPLLKTVIDFDSTDVTLYAVTEEKSITVDFVMPNGYEAIESKYGTLSEVQLPEVEVDLEGKKFGGWSFCVNPSTGYGLEEEGAVCLNRISDATNYPDYLRYEGGEYRITVYLLAVNEQYRITFKDFDGEDFADPFVLNSGELFDYHAGLPSFDVYSEAKNGNVGQYESLKGWSTVMGEGQNDGNIYKTVPDFGEDYKHVTLYAVPAMKTFTILFDVSGGSYRGVWETKSSDWFISSDYSVGDAFPSFLPNDGYQLLGYRVREAKDQDTYLPSNVIPDLADRTKYNEPEDGRYKIEAVIQTFQVRLTSDFDMNYPQVYFTSSRTQIHKINGEPMGMGDTLVKGSDITPYSIESAILMKGFQLSKFAIQGFKSERWTTIKTFDTSSYTGIPYDTYAAYDGFRISCIWTAETYTLKLIEVNSFERGTVTVTYGSEAVQLVYNRNNMTAEEIADYINESGSFYGRPIFVEYYRNPGDSSTYKTDFLNRYSYRRDEMGPWLHDQSPIVGDSYSHDVVHISIDAA